MQQMNVKMVGTTDDPIDSLSITQRSPKTALSPSVLPSYVRTKPSTSNRRPLTTTWRSWAKFPDTDIRRFADLQTALTNVWIISGAHGCKASDHALDVVMFAEANEAELDSILARRLAGETLSEHEVAQFKNCGTGVPCAEYARRGWVQQYTSRAA